MISMARGNELNTTVGQASPLNPDVRSRAATSAISTKNMTPTAVLDVVTAAPQPSRPASASVVLSAAANQSRLSTAMPELTAANMTWVWVTYSAYATSAKATKPMPLVRHRRSQNAGPL